MDGWMTPYLVMTAGADGCLVSEALLRKICTKVGPRTGRVPQEQSVWGVRLVTFIVCRPISIFERVLLK